MWGSGFFIVFCSSASFLDSQKVGEITALAPTLDARPAQPMFAIFKLASSRPPSP